MKHVRRPAHLRRTPTSHALPEAPRRTPARMAVASAAAVGITVASTLVLLPMADAGTDVSGRVIVAYQDGQAKGVVRAIEAVGGHITRMHPDIDVAVAELPAGVSRALAKSPGIKYVEPDASMRAETTPNDPLYPKTAVYPGGEFNIYRSKIDQAWTTTGYGSSSVVVAVIDTGVASQHPDLAGQVLPGRNVLTGTADVTDNVGHGTSIAGVIAAKADNGIGVAGVCSGCRVLPVKVTDVTTAYASDMAVALRWAVDNGARVANISFAGTTANSTMADAVAYARNKGVVVVAAAGNSGNSTMTYPAGYPGVIAVTATANDPGDPLQGYSNFGSWVDVAAPAGAPTTKLIDSLSGAPLGYGMVGGTSLAAPAVGGLAGLLLSANPSLTGAQLEAAVVAGADPITGVTNFGRIDAVDALSAATGTSVSAPLTSPTPVATTASPTPTTASPTPTTSTTTPTPAPSTTTPAPTPSVTATTSTFSGTLNSRKPKATFAVSALAAGQLSTALSFGCSSLTLSVVDSSGTAVSTKGGSVLRGSAPVTTGSVTMTVSGSTKCSFTLTATTP